MKKRVLLVDFDKTLSGMDAFGNTRWIKPTLARIATQAKEGAEVVIFTSMDSSNLKQDVLENIHFEELKRARDNRGESELVTRTAGLKKLQEVCIEAGVQRPDIKVMTPHDALADVDIGMSYTSLHEPTYNKYEENLIREEYRVNFKALETDNKYNQFILDELYLTRLDGIIGLLLKNKGGDIGAFTANSFEPLKGLVKLHAPEHAEEISQAIENINRAIQTKEYQQARELLEALAERVNDTVAEPKIKHVMELMLIQSTENIGELKDRFHAFLAKNVNDHEHVKTSQKIYDMAKEAGPFEHTEKFLMSLHTLRKLTENAQAGDVIDIEYLDDKHECLDEMLAAQKYFIEKVCDKPIAINVKTTLVRDISRRGDYQLESYNETKLWSKTHIVSQIASGSISLTNLNNLKLNDDQHKELLQEISEKFNTIQKAPAYPDSKSGFFFSCFKYSPKQLDEIKNLKRAYVSVLGNLPSEDRIASVGDAIKGLNSIINFQRGIPVGKTTTRSEVDKLLNAENTINLKL
ncbi:hypothetical protein [Legionella jamestowniensis]|uniref:Uncharacterized protein n=1 Tax=Legionella jamestowniensis TaxID=455 RepID=A0A0W0UYV1_9GAMM|nr:hypothetical protein [Legionella jamestowniensis]KTD13045.1 hypothetical protein Ljam_0303 [Legionella jamestowniensis]SFL79940.1 hypothetical protein SAMN02746073_2021 [Legionella jamestowniensis DSM 19215]